MFATEIKKTSYFSDRSNRNGTWKQLDTDIRRSKIVFYRTVHLKKIQPLAHKKKFKKKS